MNLVLIVCCLIAVVRQKLIYLLYFLLQTNEETLSVEQQAMVAAALSDTERFSEITDTATETIEVKATDHHPDASVGDKVGNSDSVNVLPGNVL